MFKLFFRKVLEKVVVVTSAYVDDVRVKFRVSNNMTINQSSHCHGPYRHFAVEVHVTIATEYIQ